MLGAAEPPLRISRPQAGNLRRTRAVNHLVQRKLTEI